jgi:hypothetical protein
MKLIARCPSCNTCGEVPDRFFGARIRCLACQSRFVLGSQAVVMNLLKCEDNMIIEGDSIELFACPRCSTLGFLKNNHTNRFFRCPDCKALCSLDDEPFRCRPIEPGGERPPSPAVRRAPASPLADPASSPISGGA